MGIIIFEYTEIKSTTRFVHISCLMLFNCVLRLVWNDVLFIFCVIDGAKQTKGFQGWLFRSDRYKDQDVNFQHPLERKVKFIY